MLLPQASLFIVQISTRFPFGMYVVDVKSRGRRKAKMESHATHVLYTSIAVAGGNLRYGLLFRSKERVIVVSRDCALIFLW